jgi:pyruvate formate lyase activating enzyme
LAQLGGCVKQVELMSYHRLGESKYQMLDRSYELSEVEPPDEARLESTVGLFKRAGLECKIVA